MKRLEDIFVRVCRSYLICVTLIFGIFGGYFMYIDFSPLNYINSAIAIYHFLLLFLPFRVIYKQFTYFIYGYLIFIVLADIVIVTLYSKSGQITAVIWIFLLPMGASLFKSKGNNTMPCIILSFLTTAITLILTYFSPSSFGITHLAEPHKRVADMLTVLGFLVLLSLFVYYKNKIVEIEWEIAQNANGRKPILLTSKKGNTTSRNENIYADVLTLFEQEKPYCNPNYSITDLAVKLNSNVKYVSLALRSQNFDNFNNFINSFRIRLVKEILNDDSKKKYTLQHIYISAGFRNQSTFNKAFRSIEGTTPSEYIAQKKKTQTIL